MKPLDEMKLGEVINEDMFEGVLEKPVKLTKISFTFQDLNETTAVMSLIHKDYVESEEELDKKSVNEDLKDE